MLECNKFFVMWEYYIEVYDIKSEEKFKVGWDCVRCNRNGCFEVGGEVPLCRGLRATPLQFHTYQPVKNYM